MASDKHGPRAAGRCDGTLYDESGCRRPVHAPTVVAFMTRRQGNAPSLVIIDAMDHRSNEWDYVIDRIDEMRSRAQSDNDPDAAELSRLLLVRVQGHDVDSSGTLSAASDPAKCGRCGAKFPCPTLKHEARRWRDRDDFPKHLL